MGINNLELYTQISSLPTVLKKEVKIFVEYLKSKSKLKTQIKERKFGCKKGLFLIQDNFDDPLEYFNDYQ